jgi:hypothetical protein
MNRLCTAFAVLALIAGCKKKDEPAPGTAGGSAAAPSDDAAVAAAPTDAAPGGPGLQIKVAPTTVGAVVETTTVNHASGTATMDGKSVQVIQHEESKYVATTLATDGTVATKLEVTYLAKLSHEKIGDQEKKGDGPEKGKTFIVSFADGKLTTTDKAGKPVSKAIGDELASTFGDEVGKVSPMRAIVESKTFRLGETIELTPDEVKAIAPAGDDFEVGKPMTLTLVEQKPDFAILAFDGEVRGGPGKAMQITMKGTLKVELATGRMLEMNAAGDMKGPFVGTLSTTKVNVWKPAGTVP